MFVVLVVALALVFGCETETPLTSVTAPRPPAYVRFSNVGSSSIAVDFEIRRVGPGFVVARPGVVDGAITEYLRVEAGRYGSRHRAAGGDWSTWRELTIGQETVRTFVAGYLPTTGRPLQFMGGDVLDPGPTGDDRALVRIHYFYPDGPVTDIVQDYPRDVIYRNFRYPISMSAEHFSFRAGIPLGPFLIMEDLTELFDSRNGSFKYGKAYTLILWGWDEGGGFKYTIAENGPPGASPPPTLP